jgi:hypothetical protein
MSVVSRIVVRMVRTMRSVGSVKTVRSVPTVGTMRVVRTSGSAGCGQRRVVALMRLTLRNREHGELLGERLFGVIL